MKFTLCDQCPCLNTDNESGYECNLGYSTGYVREKPVVENYPGETTLRTMSPDCDLVEIVVGRLTIKPDKVEARPIEVPKFWKRSG